jgi:hypothetical protein
MRLATSRKVRFKRSWLLPTLDEFRTPEWGRIINELNYLRIPQLANI